MTNKFANKYRIQSNRLREFDYGSEACYFITICTQNRMHYLGEIVSRQDSDFQTTAAETHNYASLEPRPFLEMSSIGKIAFQYWSEISNHYPFVFVDEFVIMPNHLHGILYVNPENKSEWTSNKFGPQSRNLGAIVRGFKSSVKRYANQNNITFHWQKNYYEHIIRNTKEHEVIKNYIINNPKNWINDKLYG